MTRGAPIIGRKSVSADYRSVCQCYQSTIVPLWLHNRYNTTLL